MANVRSTSVLDPETNDQLLVGTYRLSERARLLGLMQEPAAFVEPADAPATVTRLAGRLAREGVGRAAAGRARAHPDDAAAVDALVRALDASPWPEREWGPLRDLLGDPLLGPLTGVSPSSLARYASGSRTTPDVVASRLHLIAMACADLRGAYNDYGIRRWFVRPRPSLEGGAVVDLLGPDWDPDGPAAARVRELAASVLSIGAT